MIRVDNNGGVLYKPDIDVVQKRRCNQARIHAKIHDALGRLKFKRLAPMSNIKCT